MGMILKLFIFRRQFWLLDLPSLLPLQLLYVIPALRYTALLRLPRLLRVSDVCACVCVRACVRVCVRACVCACVCVCGWVGGWVGGSTCRVLQTSVLDFEQTYLPSI